MMPDRRKLVQSRKEAEELYFRLRMVYNEDDLKLAKALQPFYGRLTSTIKHNLSVLSFKNYESNVRFIDASKKLLDKISQLPVNANALLLSRQSASDLRLKENLQFFMSHNIHVLAPQLLLDDKDEQFWDFVKADITLCDFIICDDLLPSQRQFLERINKDKLEIFEKGDVEFIKIQALQTTLRKRDFVA